MKVNSWITGIMIPGNYTTNLPNGTLMGWDADFGDIVALDGNCVTLEDYRKSKGDNARTRKLTVMDSLIHPVNCSRGAPMGRSDIGSRPANKRIYDRIVPMSSDGAYDKGGAYWGIGTQRLRVRFTKDFSFIEFYRK